MNTDRIKSKSENYFDKVALDSKTIREPVKAYPVVLSELESLSGRILDIGCGEGEMLSIIQREYGDRFELSGVDLSGKAIGCAEEKLAGKAVFKKADVEELPFDDAYADIVLCMHSFHHYPNPQKALSEMNRVIKPGGRVMLVENHHNFFMRHLRNIYYIVFRHPCGDIKVYTMDEITELMKNAGFSKVEGYFISKRSYIIKGYREI